MTDVVETLFDLREGDRVALEAQYYEWQTPFDIRAIEEDQWVGATGEEWTVRDLDLEPGHGRGQDRTITVMSDSAAPSVGDYGRIVAVEVVERAEVDEPASEEERVRAAARGALYLNDVADELGVSIPKARALAHDAGVYESLREASRYNGANPPGERGGRHA